ncbi:MAG: hypothetical protein IKO07_08415 [Clostridia bacterium]|nr:hypothetical protein [Clostridia bacterium]
MKITFLGTAAATACPLVFCRCPVCRLAWKTGGPDFRRRSSVLIGDDLLIDLGPDLMGSAFAFGADVSKIRFLLQTHSHSDHFDAGHLITRLPDYATEDPLPLEICASAETLRHMSDALAREETGATLLAEDWQARLRLSIHPLRHGDSVTLGNRRVTAVESNHDPRDGSALYIVEEGGRAFFYATDTMRLTDRAWALFLERGFAFDAIAIDATYGPGAQGGGHLSADEAAEEIARMRAEGILKPEGRAFITHISHEGTPPHAELERFGRERGFEVARDGLTLEL